MADSPWLVDFAIRLVTSVFNLPDRQVMFLRNWNNRRSVKSILLVKKLSGQIEMTSGLVNATFTLPWMASRKNNYFLCTLKQFLKLCLIVDVWIHNLFPFLVVFAFDSDWNVGCSLGPSRERRLNVWVAYRVCDVNSKFDLCVVTKRQKWEIS